MASSSSSIEKKSFHVFISFRGEDTRRSFTCHLCKALRDKQLQTYLDEDTLEKGDEISPKLLEAIEDSKLSLVVLSRNYASSSWCLSELNHILQCKERANQLVVPIFYHVDPSIVRHQRGSFAKAFAVHKKRFKYEMEKVNQWRKALTDVANLSGFHTSANGSELDSVLIEKIVEDIINKLNSISLPSGDFEDLFGIEEHIEKMESFLSIGSEDIRIVGIWGMGGIGKSTLARVVFNKISSQFQYSKFLENVRDEVKKKQPSELQKKIFSELLGEKETLKEVTQLEKDRLRCTKVLFVLDDVDHMDQLELLAKNPNWFGRGSIIIITTRDLRLLRNIKAKIYEMKKMNTGDAFRLFNSKAFHGEPIPKYAKLSERVVAHAQGNPLTLKVLGRDLYSRSIEEWESELEKLESIPNEDVKEKLAISYYGLSSDAKSIFLDIACFFSGATKNIVNEILSYRHLGVVMEISNLIEKSLIIDDIEDKSILMHDLLIDVGREIVRKESIDDPGRRSRLCSTRDVCHVLENNLGTRAVQAISLCMHEMENDLTLKPIVFKEMCNLWFLRFFGDGDLKCKISISENLYLPDTIIFLDWYGFSSESLPPNFMPNNLIWLYMPKSSLKQLGNCVKHFKKLRFLFLSSSKSLTPMDLSYAPNLEKIDLSDCSRIGKFPVFSNPNCIQYLNMGGTSIEEVPPSMECLSSLIELRLESCKCLKSLPSNIHKLKSLTTLSLDGCSELKYLPEIEEPMDDLRYLYLTNTRIKKLPSSIKNLCGLKMLILNECDALEIVPHTIYDIPIRYFSLCGCRKIKSLPELPFSLKYLDASCCDSLEMVSIPWTVFTERPRKYIVEQTFRFSCCQKLNLENVVTEFQARVLGAIHVSISDSTEALKSYPLPAIRICLQGNNIPQWFDHQYCNESLIKMSLPPNWYKANFMGFALCLIIGFKETVETEGEIKNYLFINLHCTVCFKTMYGERHIKSHRCFDMHPIICLSLRDEMIMWSIDVNSGEVPSPIVEVSFEFDCQEEGNTSDYIEVKKCGVRMLYLEDAKQFRISNSKYLQSQSHIVIDEAEPSDPGTFDLDTDQPHQKRTKLF